MSLSKRKSNFFGPKVRNCCHKSPKQPKKQADQTHSYRTSPVRILWASRHKLTEEQYKGLQEIYGDIEITHFRKPAEKFTTILDAGRDCDILAVVAPLHIMADIIDPRNNTKPVIKSVSFRSSNKLILNQSTGELEEAYTYTHSHWEQIIQLKYETSVLKPNYDL